MGFRNNAWATVWDVKNDEKKSVVRLSISRKRNGEYVDDFTGFVTFIGDAHKGAESLKERDRIRLTECDVSNNYNKDQRREYTTYKVFSFDFGDNNGNAKADADRASYKNAKSSAKFASVIDDDDDLPL